MQQKTTDGLAPWKVRQREHLLNRFGYGGTPAQRVRYSQLGPDGWLREQIEAASDLEHWGTSPGQLQGSDTIIEGRQRTVRIVLQRMISDESSLGAVLRDFWFNHFNVFALMGIPKHQLSSYLNTCITPNLTGNFSTMLRATATHPAMLQYLDNRKNCSIAQEAEVQPGKFAFVGPNQNYARELLELHTLGVDGGYHQRDVREVTRLLSGFSSNFAGQARDRYQWRPEWHDNTPKTILGQVIPPHGESELDKLVKLLTAHPSTARFVGRKLVRRFLGEDPSPGSEEVVERTFHDTDGDLAEVMIAISNLLQAADHSRFRSRFKPPHRFIASAYRSLGVTPSAAMIEALTDEILLLGDAPFFYGPPTGYPDTYAFWLTGDGMLARAQLARRIANDPDVIAAIDLAPAAENSHVQHIADLFVPAGLTPSTMAVITAAVRGTSHDRMATEIIELVLSSPEFMRY